MKVKIKKLDKKAVIPTYAREGDAGLDLTATRTFEDEFGNIVYGTGLAFAIPKGYVGLLFPRSSNAKTNLALTNSVGVLDSGYRGEVLFKFKPMHNTMSRLKWWWQRKILKKDPLTVTVDAIACNRYKVGDRIGQIVVVKHPHITFVEADDLGETERGTGGYGSSGN